MVVSFRSLRGGLHLMPGAPERDGSSALPFAASCAQAALSPYTDPLQP